MLLTEKSKDSLCGKLQKRKFVFPFSTWVKSLAHVTSKLRLQYLGT